MYQRALKKITIDSLINEQKIDQKSFIMEPTKNLKPNLRIIPPHELNIIDHILTLKIFYIYIDDIQFKFDQYIFMSSKTKYIIKRNIYIKLLYLDFLFSYYEYLLTLCFKNEPSYIKYIRGNIEEFNFMYNRISDSQTTFSIFISISQ